jgi:Family of unknown function (DUF6335)
MPRKKPELRRRRKGRWVGRGENRSMTGHVVESLESGVAPPVETPPIPEPEGRLIRMGDPDVDPLQNEYAGEESPGATTPTPDQNLIDATGRAYGVGNAESGALRTSSEILDERDRKAGLTRPKGRRRL